MKTILITAVIGVAATVGVITYKTYFDEATPETESSSKVSTEQNESHGTSEGTSQEEAWVLWNQWRSLRDQIRANEEESRKLQEDQSVEEKSKQVHIQYAPKLQQLYKQRDELGPDVLEEYTTGVGGGSAKIIATGNREKRLAIEGKIQSILREIDNQTRPLEEARSEKRNALGEKEDELFKKELAILAKLRGAKSLRDVEPLLQGKQVEIGAKPSEFENQIAFSHVGTFWRHPLEPFMWFYRPVFEETRLVGWLGTSNGEFQFRARDGQILWQGAQPPELQQLEPALLAIPPKDNAWEETFVGFRKSKPRPILTVHSKSRLSAKEISQMLQNSRYLPANVRRKIQQKKNKILLPTTQEAASNEQWVNDFLSIKDEWEITTGRLTIVLGPNGDIKGQSINEEIIPLTESRGRIRDEADPVSTLIRVTDSKCDFTKDEEDKNKDKKDKKDKNCGVMFAKTIPSLALSDRKSFTEIVDLQSGKGLIIIVDQIVVKKGDLVAPPPSSPIKVPKALIEQNLIHEIAAHAGLFSQKLPAAHDTGRVNSNIEAIEKKNNITGVKGNVLREIKRYLDAMKKGTYDVID